VPVDPRRAGVSSLAFGAAVLARGKSLIWFPEGERSPSGELQRFKPGIGMLLEHFQTPVVPVSIHGTYKAMPRGKATIRPTKITVVFGEALDIRDLLERAGEDGEPQDPIVQTLYKRMAKLGGQC
jgi:long-chain acyl-CoA synthetase